MGNNNLLEKVEYVPMTNFSSIDVLYMLKDLPDACCIFKVLMDASGNIKDMLFLFANEKYGQLVGKRSAELVGTTYFEAVGNIDEDWINYSYQSAILRKSIIKRTYNSRFNRWFEFWAVPVYQNGYCAFVIHDVSALAENENNLKFSLNTDRLSMQCASLVASGQGRKGIIKAFEKLGNAIGADRIHIVNKNSQIYEDYEWKSETAINLPRENDYRKNGIFNLWKEEFNSENFIICEDTKTLKDFSEATYENVFKDNVLRYVVIKLVNKEKTIGYLVAENYEKNLQVDIVNVMCAFGLFLSSELRNKILSEEMIYIESHDVMTQFYNSKMFGQNFEFLSNLNVNLGICFIKLDKTSLLSSINDNTTISSNLFSLQTEKIAKIFDADYCYRLGDLDFLAMIPEIEEEKFKEKVLRIKDELKNTSVLIGHEWNKSSKNIAQIFKNITKISR